MPSAPCAWAATCVPGQRGLLHRGSDLVLGELGCPRVGPAGEHRTGRDDLDEVRPVAKDLSDVGSHLVDARRHAETQVARHDAVDVDREAGEVAATAGTGDVGTGASHARAEHVAGIDRLPERDVDERAERADVAHGGEPGARIVRRAFRTPPNASWAGERITNDAYP